MDFFVNMHDGLNNHYMVDESKFAAEGVNWPQTMFNLARRLCPKRPLGTRLEINSHGEPGKILLNPPVGLGNLAMFSSRVRALLKPGGFIEILSCRIACPPQPSLAVINAASAHQLAPADRKLYALQRELQVQYNQLIAGDPIKSRLSGQDVVDAVLACINRAGELGTAENGPLFCSRLAAQTDCVVRAATISQAEDHEKSGNQHFDTPFGNWEGHVLDFQPGGGVRYVGLNVPRIIFRLHDEHGDGPLRFS